MSSLDDVERIPICSCTSLRKALKSHVEISLNLLTFLLSVNSVLFTSYGTHLFLDPGKLWVLLLTLLFGSKQYWESQNENKVYYKDLQLKYKNVNLAWTQVYRGISDGNEMWMGMVTDKLSTL